MWCEEKIMNNFWEEELQAGYYDDILSNGLRNKKGIQANWHNLTFLKVGNLSMNLLTREVHRSNIKIDLQPREFRLLEFLMRRSNQVVTRTMLLEGVWEYHFDPQTNVIDVHISRLRSKIDKPFDEDQIRKIIK